MDEENKKETLEGTDDDVELINKTIPELIIEETSFVEANPNSGDCANTKEESFAEETAQTAHGNFDEQQLIDMVVVDDDYCSSANLKDVKIEPKWSNDLKPNLDDLAKSEANVKEVKNEEVNESQPSSSKSPKLDDIFLVHCAIRQSLSSETFVLQLENSDALDSYLDKTQNETVEEKLVQNAGSVKNEGEMKENDSNQLNVPICKPLEGDALILTADDELDTELEEKHSNALNKMLESDKPAEPEEVPDVKLELVSNTDNKPVAPKTEPSESIIETVDQKDCPNLSESNRNITVQEKADSKIGSKKIDPPATHIRGRNVPAASTRVLWVSNVTQSVRAGDLKQYISKIGKVVTAKIVTDGKNCYGYVVMDNSDDANKCLKTLNNAYFDGRKISLSFTRPPRANCEKKEGPSKTTDSTKKEPSFGSRKSGNETDDTKVRKSQERGRRASKRHRSHSRSLSSKISKRQSPNDPLTTKFDDRKRTRSSSKHKSRSRDRKYLREREERERLQRNLLEEQRRSRDEMLKQIQREEKHREIEFKLEQERRKLQLERELFEKERRELTRLDIERRKIEKERLEVLKQRSKLQEEIEKSRSNRRSNLSSVIGKPQESEDLYDKRKESLKKDEEYSRKPSNSKHSFSKTAKNGRDERKVGNDAKSCPSSVRHRSLPKSDFKTIKDGSKVVKPYEKSTPPPPKLTNDFDHKPKHSDRKHEYSESKPIYGDRKSERGARKIEVIERKYYQERASDGPERKHERVYRKAEFEGRKPHMFPERKYDYGRDTKRYPNENYTERDSTQRIQWPAAAVNYNDPWKTVPASPVSGSAAVRYQEPNFPGASYGGPSRIAPFYYHPTSAPQDYPRYDHVSQANGRKY